MCIHGHSTQKSIYIYTGASENLGLEVDELQSFTNFTKAPVVRQKFIQNSAFRWRVLRDTGIPLDTTLSCCTGITVTYGAATAIMCQSISNMTNLHYTSITKLIWPHRATSGSSWWCYKVIQKKPVAAAQVEDPNQHKWWFGRHQKNPSQRLGVLWYAPWDERSGQIFPGREQVHKSTIKPWNHQKILTNIFNLCLQTLDPSDMQPCLKCSFKGSSPGKAIEWDGRVPTTSTTTTTATLQLASLWK